MADTKPVVLNFFENEFIGSFAILEEDGEVFFRWRHWLLGTLVERMPYDKFVMLKNMLNTLHSEYEDDKDGR